MYRSYIALHPDTFDADPAPAVPVAGEYKDTSARGSTRLRAAGVGKRRASRSLSGAGTPQGCGDCLLIAGNGGLQGRSAVPVRRIRIGTMRQ